MSAQAEQKKPPRSFWIVASVSLIWNLIGVVNYLFSVTVSAQTLAAMPAAERALYTDVPVFLIVCAAFFLWYSRKVAAQGLLR